MRAALLAMLIVSATMQCAAVSFAGGRSSCVCGSRPDVANSDAAYPCG
jgi:hypothetical protein